MSDQHVVTDWKAYFEALGPGTPSPLARDVAVMYDGPVRCAVTYPVKLDLVHQDMPEGRELFEWALEVWQANDRPEMWIFCNLSGPPWHVNADPVAKPQKGRKA